MTDREYIDVARGALEDGAGGVEPVSGAQARAQAIVRMLIHPPGTLPLSPELGAGLIDAVGRPATAGEQAELERRARRLLDALSEVEDYTFVLYAGDPPGALRFDLTLQINGERVVLRDVEVA